jgi:hypothetical protein
LSCAPTHPENEDIKQHCRHATLPLLILWRMPNRILITIHIHYTYPPYLSTIPIY